MIAKRLFDFVGSLLGLLILLPLFVVIAVCIKRDSEGPVFFRQERVGLQGRPFRIHKFRTMQSSADQSGPQITAREDPRITRVGAVLRKYKLDELPQLIDVLLGRMSLVGPRPEVPKYLALYPYALRVRVLSVRPGITDWASIRFRNEQDMLRGAVDAERKYADEILPIKQSLYLEYVDRRSFLGDLRIIAATIAVSLKGR